MKDQHNEKSPVVVGIDGSDTAISAALWAIDEAFSRNVPLRLLFVIRSAGLSANEYSEVVNYAKASLRAATAAVQSGGKPVTVNTAIVEGPPGAALVDESERATMVCVGTVGIGGYARSILGSTAAELAEQAHCPVAVIRPHGNESTQHVSWIIVAANGKPEQAAVIEFAMQEATLRRSPVLLLGNTSTTLTASSNGLDSEIQQWQRRYPELHIYPITDRADVARFVKHHDEPVELAVIGASDAGELAEIVGSHHRRPLHHIVSSALVVRQ